MARLLLVEDEIKLGATLEEGLGRAQHTVDVALDGEEGLAFAQSAHYDVIILDVMLPKVDGFEVCRRLRTAGERAPILMLTARDTVGDRIHGLDLGADDYLVKPFAFGELLARVRALLRRESPSKSSVLQVSDLTLDPAAQRVEWAGQPIELTAREYRILEALMRRPGWVLSREAIIESIWGFDFPDTSNVVEVYVGRIRRKLAEQGAPTLIQTVRGAGYRLGPRHVIGRAWPLGGARPGWLARRGRLPRWRRPGWRNLSVRARLTIWYMALLAGTLIGLITLGWLLARQQLYGNADEVLRSKAAAVATEVDVSKGKMSFSFDGAKKGAPPQVAIGLDVVRVWDVSHRPIYRFPPGTQLGQPGPTALDETLAGVEQFATVQSEDGTLLRILYQPIVDKGKIIGAIQVARSQGELDALLARMRELGLVGVVLGLLVAWGGGSFLANRVLRPVDQIRLAAERIGAEDLSLRLDPPATEDELGRLISAFNNMIERLDRAFQQQQRFTADASHELRTPLTVIRSLADVALSSPPDQAYDRRVLASICEESDRLGRLLESLLVLARADQGQVLMLDAIDLDDVVLDAAERIALRARQEGVSLSVTPTDGERVIGDASLLTQLLVNLLENAVRHTPPGGRVTLAARRAVATNEIVLTVADTGEGIAPEHLPRLFDRFYRVDSARSRGTGGFGLGLAICQWIVQAHHGTITVQSAPGIGTTFEIRLPRPVSARALPRPDHAPPALPEHTAARS